MTEGEQIIRVAAKGDGITANGTHVSGSAPGDILLADGTLRHGPHHAIAPCRHFQKCGGCQLQHLDEESLSAFVTSRVVNAAQGQDLEPKQVGAAYLCPPQSRRRATLHAMRTGGRILLGFREAGSHHLVDLAECPVLRSELSALIGPLRTMLSKQAGKRLAVDIEMVLADQGVDISLKGLTVEGLEATEAVLDFARENGLARLTIDQGFGPEPMWEPNPVTIRLGGVSAPLPPGAFLQAAAEGEEALVSAAREWLGDCATIADLFSGLGTFAFALSGSAKVLAVEAARDTHLACKSAADRAQLPVHALHRDLFRNPLQTEELNRFDAVLLDPPRAGAKEQVRLLAASTVKRVVYISCNPSSWARDAAMLVQSGYRLEALRPVGQFRWSTHVELASLFIRS